MELVVPALVILFLYLIFHSVQEKKSPFLSLMWLILCIILTGFLSLVLGSVKAHYSGQAEWSQEKQFFLQLFIDKLASSGDLQTAAEYMQSPEVKEQTLVRIRQIVSLFFPKTVFSLSLGGFILLLSVISLWIKKIRVKKFYPYIYLLSILIGGILFDLGIYYWQYASRTDRMLKNFLRLQQTYVMKNLAEVKTNLRIPEIIDIAQKEACNKTSWGMSLLNSLFPEKQAARGKNKSRLRTGNK